VRNRLLQIVVCAGLLGSTSSLAATSNYLDEAQRLQASGQLRAAEIELKNAVLTDQKNMTAHYRLAIVQLQLGEAAAAEHEASIARADGFDPEKVVPVLLEAYLLQGKYKELLNDFPATSGSLTLRANELVARGDAQLALQNPDEAKASFERAQQLAPKAPQPILAEAKLALMRHDLKSAETLFDRALTIAPNFKEALVGKSSVMQAKGDTAPALSLLGQALAAAPDYAPARLARAQIFLRQGKDQQAKADVDAVLKTQPRNGGAIYLEALLDVQKHNFQQADTELQKISGVIAAIPRGYYIQALVQFNLHQLDQAADSARRYTARNPDDLAGAKLLGLIELSRDHPAQAVEALSKFSSSGKADAGALDLLGRADGQAGKITDALAAFSQAVKLAPKNPALLLRLGATQMRAGDVGEAVKNLQQSFALKPSAPAAELLVMTDMETAQWKSATDAIDQLQKVQPNSPVPANLLGLVKLAQLDLPGAESQFSDILKQYPDYMSARLNLAQAKTLAGKFDEAENILQQVLAKEPANGMALTRLVSLLLNDGKNDAALAAAQKAHAAAPSNAGITAGLVDLYIRLGHKDQGLALARQETGENTATDFPLILARARAEFASGLKTEALQTYQRLIAIAPTRPDLRLQYASALLSAGDQQGARRALDEALKADPSNLELADARIAVEGQIGGVDAALAEAAAIQKADPNLPGAVGLEGDAYRAVKMYEPATDAYTKVFQHAPAAWLALRIADAKNLAGHSDAAAATLHDWLVKHPADVPVAEALGNDDINAHHYDEAQKEFEFVLSKRPQDVVALNDLAWLYQRAKDPQARAFAERAYVLQPNSAQTADTLGWILVQQGQPADAIGLLKRASVEQKTDSAIQYHLAVALNDLGHPKEAMALLTPLIKQTVNFDDKPAAEKLYAELLAKK
jgi:cellulose synthase operon protein C